MAMTFYWKQAFFSLIHFYIAFPLPTLANIYRHICFSLCSIKKTIVISQRSCRQFSKIILENDDFGAKGLEAKLTSYDGLLSYPPACMQLIWPTKAGLDAIWLASKELRKTQRNSKEPPKTHRKSQ